MPWRWESTDITGGTGKTKDKYPLWEQVGQHDKSGYDPHNPDTFVNPYEGINPEWTPEQLQQHIDSGKQQLDHQWKMYDLWYNSETEKVKRLLAAGLNPDLLGLETASETSSQPTPLSDAGDLSIQSEQLEIQRDQMLVDTLSQVGGLLSSAGQGLYSLALEQAQIASSVLVGHSTARLQDAQTKSTLVGVSNLQSSLDTMSYEFAHKSAMQDMSIGYKDGMSPNEIAALIKFDGMYHSDKTISDSIARHKRAMVGNIAYANEFLKSRSDSSKSNIEDMALSDYYIPSDSVRKTLKPLMSTAFDMYLTDMYFKTNFNRFQNQILSGVSVDKIYNTINQEFALRYDNAFYEQKIVPNRFSALGAQYDADRELNKDKFGYYSTRNYYSAGSQLGITSIDIDDNLAVSANVEARKQMMALQASVFLEQLQNGYLCSMQDYAGKLKNGSFSIIDASNVAYWNAVYNDINNSVSNFLNPNGSSLFGNTLNTAVSAGSSLADTIVKLRGMRNPKK